MGQFHYVKLALVGVGRREFSLVSLLYNLILQSESHSIPHLFRVTWYEITDDGTTGILCQGIILAVKRSAMG